MSPSASGNRSLCARRGPTANAAASPSSTLWAVHNPFFVEGVAHAHNLCERLKKHEGAMRLFACDSDVLFTNNGADRSPRISKAKQKVPGRFRKAE